MRSPGRTSRGLLARGMSLLVAMAVALPPLAHAQEPTGKFSLETSGVLVDVDANAGTFALTDRATGVVYIKHGRPAAKLRQVRPVRLENGPFGKANAIEMVGDNGDVTTLAICPSDPFVFIRVRHTNTGAAPEPVTDLRPVRLPLNLPCPATELKVLGTGGLKAPDENPGSYTFLAVADPKTRAGVVAAWLTQDRGSGLIFSRVENGAVVIEPRCEYGGLPLEPGSALDSEWLAVTYAPDARLALEHYADLAATYYGIKLPPQPCGYCTWYSDHSGGASDQEHVKELADFGAEHLGSYGFDFVQIDDQWQGPPRDNQPLNAGTWTEEYLGKPADAKDRWWNGPHSDFTTHHPNGPYGKAGMKRAAADIKAAGLTPGLWLLPFAWNPTCDALRDHHDWFVKQPNGSLYYAFWAGWCLDMTHPDARDFLASNIRRICRDWGFSYLKLDGLWTGMATNILYINNGYQPDDFGKAVFHDERVTPVEAYRQGLKLVREAAGKKTFLLGCNVAQNMRTLGASFGLVDAMRIGPDNGQEWWAIVIGPWHGTNRYFLNGHVWYNDPDPVYVRAKVPLEHARILCSWAAVSGQLTVSSDWLPDVPPERLDILRRVMPAHRLPARPVDYFERDFPRIWQVTDADGGARRDIVGVFNWDSEKEAAIEVTSESLQLPSGTPFACFDFWANTFLPTLSDKLELNVPPASCRVLAIRALERHPFVISTSRHITQGAIDLTNERWNNDARQLSGVSQLVAGDPYELRIVLPAHEPAWEPVSITVNNNRVATALDHTADGVRATLTGKKSATVAWSVTFQ